MNLKLFYQTLIFYTAGLFHSLKAVFVYRNETVTKATLGEELSMYCFGSRFDAPVIKRNGKELFSSVYENSKVNTVSGRYILTYESISRITILWTITIPEENMTEEEHNSRWECTSLYTVKTLPSIQTVILYLQVPVNETNITNAPQNLAFVKEGYQLTCVSAKARPAASISWYIDGKEAENRKAINSSVSGDDASLFNTVSTLTIWGDVSKGTQTIHCEGYNIQGYPPVRSTSIKINTLFNPGESPTIEGYTPGRRLLPSDPPLLLSCRIRKSLPNPTMSWICPYSANEKFFSNGQHIVRTIEVKVDTKLNGETCTCVVTHPVDNFNRQASVTFIVLGHQYINSRMGIVGLGVGIACLAISLTLLMIATARYKHASKLSAMNIADDEASERNDDIIMSNTQPSQQLYEAVKNNQTGENLYTALSTGNNSQRSNEKRKANKHNKAKNRCKKGRTGDKYENVSPHK